MNVILVILMFSREHGIEVIQMNNMTTCEQVAESINSWEGFKADVLASCYYDS